MKNGFTLVELLAVIVILSAIALITTIETGSVIKKSKNNLSEVQITKIEEAAKIYYLKEGINKEIEGSSSCVSVEKLIEKGYIEAGQVLDPKTKKAVTGSVLISNNSNKYSYKYQQDSCKIITTLYNNGEEVYFDVITGKSCKNYHEDNSTTGYNGINPTGNQTSCLKFYAFLDDGSDTVNLILDHNTTATLAWNSSGSNTGGPSEVLTSLYEDTKEWKGTETPSNYKMDQTGQTSGANYTITYSEAPEGETEAYKARLITAQELAEITGADKEDTLNWKEESSTTWYYLDGAKTNDTVPNWQTPIANSTNPSVYYWLFDRTYDCISYGCKVSDNSNDGYWTSSSIADYSERAWFVDSLGRVDISLVDYEDHIGLRPVITVLKSNL